MRLEYEENRLFFRNWLKEFKSILPYELSKEIDYIQSVTTLATTFQKTPNNPSHLDLKRAYSFHDKFFNSFIKLCQKHGVDVRADTSKFYNFGLDYNALPINCSLFTAHLVDQKREIEYRLQKLASTRKRKRLPDKISFEIARLIHFCHGKGEQKKEAKTKLAAMLEMKDTTESLYFLIKKLYTLQLKVNFTIRYLDQKDQLEISSKHSSKLRNSQLSKLRKKRRHLRKFQINWCIWGNRKHDTNWMSHLKEHLIRSILSEGHEKISKSFKEDRLQERKNGLIFRMEQKNEITLRVKNS